MKRHYLAHLLCKTRSLLLHRESRRCSTSSWWLSGNAKRAAYCRYSLQFLYVISFNSELWKLSLVPSKSKHAVRVKLRGNMGNDANNDKKRHTTWTLGQYSAYQADFWSVGRASNIWENETKIIRPLGRNSKGKSALKTANFERGNLENAHSNFRSEKCVRLGMTRRFLQKKKIEMALLVVAI